MKGKMVINTTLWFKYGQWWKELMPSVKSWLWHQWLPNGIIFRLDCCDIYECVVSTILTKSLTMAKSIGLFANPKMHLFHSYKAPFRTEMCTFLFWMARCGIWSRRIMRLVYWCRDWGHACDATVSQMSSHFASIVVTSGACEDAAITR